MLQVVSLGLLNCHSAMPGMSYLSLFFKTLNIRPYYLPPQRFSSLYYREWLYKEGSSSITSSCCIKVSSFLRRRCNVLLLDLEMSFEELKDQLVVENDQVICTPEYQNSGMKMLKSRRGRSDNWERTKVKYILEKRDWILWPALGVVGVQGFLLSKLQNDLACL